MSAPMAAVLIAAGCGSRTAPTETPGTVLSAPPAATIEDTTQPDSGAISDTAMTDDDTAQPDGGAVSAAG